MLTSLKVLKDSPRLFHTRFHNHANTFLGVYANVRGDSWCQLSDSATQQTYMKIRRFVEWKTRDVVYEPLRDAIEETL